MSDETGATCRTGYNAAHKSGSRALSSLKLIVLHSTEGGTAESVARYFTSQGSGGSAQLVVDDNACYRCLPDTEIPWGAPGANTQGVHIEFCGFAHWSDSDWHHHESMLHRGAYKVAYWAKEYDIPAVHLSVADARAGHKGIVTHADVTNAWHLTDHTDPGPGFPMTYFLGLVRGYLTPGNPKPPPPPKPDKHWFIMGAGGTGPFGPAHASQVLALMPQRMDNVQGAHGQDADTDPDVVIQVVYRPKGA